MAARSPLLEHLVDQLAAVGSARGRAMFGGHGLYLDGLITGIVVDETLYLKVDEANRADYEAAGMRAFRYEKSGRTVATSYWEVPSDVVEEPESLRAWTMRAHAAARRGTHAKVRRAVPRP